MNRNNWKFKKLGDYCRIFNGNSINADYKKKHFTGLTIGYPFIATKDVSFNGEINYDNGVRIPFETDYKTANPGSVFICAEGGSAGRKIARVNKKVCFGNKLFCIEPRNGVIGDYLYYYLISDSFQNQFKEQLAGLIGGVNAKKFNNFVFPILSLAEQQEIVDYLDKAFAKIDALKKNAEQQLSDAKALFSAALEESMTPQKGWEEKLLKETAIVFSRGKSKHRPRNDKKLFGGEYPFIQTGEIRNAIKYIEDFSTTYNEFGLQQSKLWPKGTICITIAANIAEVAILSFPCCFPDSVIGLVPNTDEYDTDFVYYSILSFQNQLKELGKGAAQDNINLGTFETVKLPFPELKAQQSIVAHLDALSSKVNQLQDNYNKILRECDALKQALLREIFEQ